MARISTWATKDEPVGNAGIDGAIREYVAEVGRRLFGRPATDAEVRTVLERDPHSDLTPPLGVFLVARGGDGDLLGCVGVRL